MPVVTIDDQSLEVEPGTLIIQAADRLGIEVPRFCYHPDLRPEGNCRTWWWRCAVSPGWRWPAAHR